MDGLGIAEPERRVDIAAARAALARDAAAVEPTADGRGARLWLGSQRVGMGELRWLALAEQRFLRDAFAGLRREQLQELTALLTLCGRLAIGSQPSAAAASSGMASSSALPTITPRHSFPGIIGSSRALRSALARLDAAIDSELPLLLTGETGVGKELFARAVAELGPRRGRPFVAVNCAAIAGGLFEAEFFGHERGAFTGAERRRSGVFMQADGGVLLLDEVGELPLSQQVALLRALETRRVRPLGADEERKFDVRLIAATNRDLEQAVAEGSFRRDLLYRINVLEVRIPALRERADDIEALAEHFLRAQGSRVSISAPALRAMAAYGWPGNVRELAHTVLRLSALHDQSIELAHLPRHIRAARSKPRAVRPLRAVSERRAPDDPREEVLQTLEQTGGNISHAARVLGLTRHGLKKRMLRLGLRRPPGEIA
jgi:transcriptional regulator with GAF, ATPase, and Fis domain